MELRYLRSFVTVAETLHFGRAGEQLRVAQPAISQHIQKLEASLGAQLFDRSRHGVALTAIGRVFLREARSILAQVQYALDQVEKAKAGGEGSIRLGYVPGPSRELLTRSLQIMRKESPGVQVELRELYPGKILQDLLDGNLDFALVPELAPPYPRGLGYDVVGHQRVMLALGQNHPLAAQEVIKVADLADSEWVIYDDSLAPGYRKWVAEVCASGHFRPRIARSVTTSNDLHVTLSTLPGVAVLPEGYRFLFTQGVVFRPLVPEPERLGVWAWYRKEDASPAVTAFRRALSKVVGCDET